MSDEEKKPPPPPPSKPYPAIASEQWSAISQGDLGLQAGYWANERGGPIVFRPILGWITWNGTNLVVPTEPSQHNFAAVVLSETYFPTVAGFLPNFIGVFPKDMSPEDARKKFDEWNAAGQPEPQVNTGHVGGGRAN